MRLSTTFTAAALASVAIAAPASPTATDAADVHAAQATAKSESPVSKVKGAAFDRYVSIWFENTDYDMAAGDPNFQYFMKQGITLTQNYGVTHPSEPNYMAAVGGDYFGLDGDPFTQVPQNVSSVIDLLEDKGISWAMYQEDMPYTGYQGFSWVNQQNGKNDYVRKHNPAVLYNSVVTNQDRLEKIKNTTLFYEDLSANTLPQWMFITPNMTSDGHDSSITVAGNWLRGFLEPLLTNKNFMQNTLVLITFDENETYSIKNNILGVLLGDAVPSNLVGTQDTNYYNHYSEIATVEANWGLHTLGRYDVGANVFSWVAQKTGDVVRSWNANTGVKEAFANMYFNYSYPGIFNSNAARYAVQPVPNSLSFQNLRSVLPSIAAQWIGQELNTVYSGALEIPDGYHIPSKVLSL